MPQVVDSGEELEPVVCVEFGEELELVLCGDLAVALCELPLVEPELWAQWDFGDGPDRRDRQGVESQTRFAT